MAALAHNPGSQAERYKDYAHRYAQTLGVLWQKPVKGVAGQAGRSAGKGNYAAGSAFITEDDEKVIESPTPNTLGNLYLWMHELSHHHKGHIDKNLPYHMEEYEATKEALDTMIRDGFQPTPAIWNEAAWNLKHAIDSDRREGVGISPKVEEYLELMTRNGGGKADNPFFGLFGGKKGKAAREKRIAASSWRNVEVGDLVKAMFSAKGQTERMWVRVVKVTKSGVVGVLDNYPVVVPLKFGDRVTVPWGRIVERSANPGNPEKFDRCVRKVKARSKGRGGVNAYAVCTAAGTRKGNPDSSAASMFESFHGSPSEEVLEFREEEHYHGNLAGLGVLVELKLVTTTGYDVTLTFSDPEALIASNPGIWDRLKSIGSRSTVYPVPRQTAKMTKVGTAKGHEIFKTREGDYRVPSLERESSFDTLGDAKKFVGSWKGNPGRHYPDELRIMGSIREGEMILKSKKSVTGRKMSPAELGAVQRAVDNSKAKLAQLQVENDARYGKNPGPFQSASKLIGSTGKYLDDQLGKVLKGKRKSNPTLDPALLCSNEDGTQVYILGGDQSVDLKAIHMGDVKIKDSMILGEAYYVSYFTEKDFDKFKSIEYCHDLAEEADPPSPKYKKDEIHTSRNRKLVGQGTGFYPMVRLDTMNNRLYLDGGDYHIQKPLFQTSPGLEN